MGCGRGRGGPQSPAPARVQPRPWLWPQDAGGGEVGDHRVGAKTQSVCLRYGASGCQSVNGVRSPSTWVSSCPPPISPPPLLHLAS